MRRKLPSHDGMMLSKTSGDPSGCGILPFLNARLDPPMTTNIILPPHGRRSIEVVVVYII